VLLFLLNISVISMQERFKCPVAVHLFMVKDNKILLQLRNCDSFKGFYSVVAGHLDGGESVINATIREAKEEIGVDIEYKNLKLATFCHSCANNSLYVQIFFWCNEWSGDIKNLEPDKAESLGWFEMNQLPDNTVPYVLRALRNTVGGEVFYEDGF